MKSLSYILTAIGAISLTALPLIAQDSDEAKQKDLINFKNDDLLHGRFLGFTTSGKIIWKNDFAEKNIAFEKSEVRKIVINKGELHKPFTHNSFIKLKNNNTIPCKIISMKGGNLIIETDYCGELSIPSHLISNVEFNPHGNQIIYRGPFAEEKKWELKYAEQHKPKEDQDEEEKIPDAWLLKNFSLQHQGQPSSIMMKKELPEQFRSTFYCYTNQSRLPFITILADLNVPEIDKENTELVQNRSRYKSTIASYLGTCLVIKPHASGATLTHYGYKEDGSIYLNNLTNNIKSSSSRNNALKRFYDLRVDTKKGQVMLYLDKKHVGQWEINDMTTKLTGKHLGFNMQYSNGSNKTIVSDLIITKWNGVTDSARSLENATRDIVMLSNGTDRYSGKVTAITDTTVEINTDYAELSIPHEEVSSVNFATEKTVEIPQEGADKVTVRFYGTGSISGKISKAEDGYIAIDSKALGLIKVRSEYISSFEFIDMDHVYDVHN